MNGKIPFPIDDRVIERVDYIVVAGDVFQVRTDQYQGTSYLVEVDEVPEEYWQRFPDGGGEDPDGMEERAQETVECGDCGAERYTWEACPECGTFGGDV